MQQTILVNETANFDNQFLPCSRAERSNPASYRANKRSQRTQGSPQRTQRKLERSESTQRDAVRKANGDPADDDRALR